ncbi:MAG: DUF3333 domain-containing protein, partial [Pseudomonadota bacterium]
MNEASASPATAMAERLRQRRNAERRFKLYGQAAIAIAIGFLAFLLISIAAKSASAFSRHMVDLSLEQPGFASQTDISVTDINLAVRDKLIEIFPESANDRVARADLFAITTRLAVLPLRDSLKANPERANLPIKARLALSDDLDLYLKNNLRKHRSTKIGEAGRLSQSGASRYRLTAAGRDGFVAFQDELQALGGVQQDILISLEDAWFELESVSGAALVLNHLAGPLPAIGEQASADITATYLNSISGNRKVSNRQIAAALHLKAQGLITR